MLATSVGDGRLSAVPSLSGGHGGATDKAVAGVWAASAALRAGAATAAPPRFEAYAQALRAVDAVFGRGDGGGVVGSGDGGREVGGKCVWRWRSPPGDDWLFMQRRVAAGQWRAGRCWQW